MVVICEECGKIYHLDPGKLMNHIKTPDGIKIKCKVCEHIITIRPPGEEDVAVGEGSGPIQSVPVSENSPEPDAAPAPPATPPLKVVSKNSDPEEKTADGPRVARKKKTSYKGFGLRTKMFFLFFGIPILLFIGSSAFTQYQMLTLANSITGESTDVVRQMAEEIIVNKAKSVASQCSIFLRNNPDLNKDDFYYDFDMRDIAVQDVGTEGFTALIEIPAPDQDEETGYRIWCHRNESYLGKPLLSKMKEELGLGYQSFEEVFKAMKGGRGIKGYYRTVSADNTEKEKFMAVEPIEQTPYLILSTTFIEDFTGPIQLIEKSATGLTEATQKMTIGFIAVVILFIGLSIMIYGYRLTSNIQMLTDAADRISVGELDVVIDIKSRDEIGSLAEAVTRMQDSLRFSIERLRKKR
ncbi:HAMP domain-containing protein [Desulfoluna butyratoxydans]|uniref:histidine kinase n=1 Tax=Desulfoluna butyratoxydans TaxID=231438 RepID=A0A4U8YXB4_9BACT|nr:HAMP domain-containing protein [Desulfoluna butyratoxydans]VFQ46692.1 hamp domain [Desulfoluna butyratoxydans]